MVSNNEILDQLRDIRQKVDSLIAQLTSNGTVPVHTQKRDNEVITIQAKIIAETPKALRLICNDCEGWIPKSQIKGSYNADVRGVIQKFTIPRWMQLKNFTKIEEVIF